MSELRKVGDLLELSLQLGDGSVNTAITRVFCELKDSDKALLEPKFELTDDADGLYTDDKTKVMPDEVYITATYTITDIGGVTLTTLYTPQVSVEGYLKDVTGQIVEDNLDAKVSSVSGGSGGSSQDNIEGTVEADESLIGELGDSSLIAELSDDTILEGEVQDEF